MHPFTCQIIQLVCNNSDCLLFLGGRACGFGIDCWLLLGHTVILVCGRGADCVMMMIVMEV